VRIPTLFSPSDNPVVSNSTAGIMTHYIQTTNNMPFEEFDLEKMLPGFLIIFLFFKESGVGFTLLP